MSPSSFQTLFTGSCDIHIAIFFVGRESPLTGGRTSPTLAISKYTGGLCVVKLAPACRFAPGRSRPRHDQSPHVPEPQNLKRYGEHGRWPNGPEAGRQRAEAVLLGSRDLNHRGRRAEQSSRSGGSAGEAQEHRARLDAFDGVGWRGTVLQRGMGHEDVEGKLSCDLYALTVS
nr:hypothetical protein CFP56_70568 [Quercus suber]